MIAPYGEAPRSGVSNHEVRSFGPALSFEAPRGAWLLRMRRYSTSFSDALASSTRSSSRNIFSAFDCVSNTIVVRSGTV